MRADVPAIIDANVLADSALGDLILRLSEEPRLILPRWSQEILDETHRTLIEKLGWEPEMADSWIGAAVDAFPEAMISDYETLMSKCTNHEADRHILAAAIWGNCESIVTMNVRHFRAEHVEHWGISAVHPDEYLQVRYEHRREVVVNVIQEMARKRKKPLSQMLSRIGAPAPKFAARVGSDLKVNVPSYDPATYKEARED